MKAFDLIIFDLDGTLYRFELSGNDAFYTTEFSAETKQRGIKFLSKKLNISEKRAEQLREDISLKYKGEISIGLEKEFGIPRADYFSNAWDVDASKYIKQDYKLRILLNKLPIKKAVLTAAPQIWADRALKQLGVYTLFDGLWYGDGDIRKPSRKAYAQVMDALGVESQRVIVVDDQPKCLESAKKLGVTTVLVGPERASYINYSLAEIYELAGIFRGEQK